MSFANPYVLLALTPVVIWLAIEIIREHQRTAALAFPALPGRRAPKSLRVHLRYLPTLLRFILLTLIVIALAEPRVPSDEVPIYSEGIDIVVAFDISTSMKALDFEPSDRFTVARDTISEFVAGRETDRVGLVVFAGEAYTQCPLTLDHAVLKNVLSQVKMDVIEDGTAIGDAVATSVNRLRKSEAKSKVIVLLTDGANNRGRIDPTQAAMLAKEFDIRVYTIQVGKGGRVPYPVQTRDFFTNQVVTRKQYYEIPVNPDLLRDIAERTGGRFFVAGDSDSLKNIFNLIDEMEKTELPGEEFVLYDEIYSAFAWPALVLLLFELAMRLFWLRKFP